MGEPGNHELLPQNERPCFPVSVDALNKVQQEIDVKFGGDMEQFVDHEEKEIEKDKNLKTLLDTAFGWYQDFNDDRRGFLEGESIVHRALRTQGTTPLIPEDTSAALVPITDRYESAADENEVSVGRFLASPETPKFFPYERFGSIRQSICARP